MKKEIKERKVALNITIEPSYLNLLEKEAEEKEESISALVRKVLHAYVSSCRDNKSGKKGIGSVHNHTLPVHKAVDLSALGHEFFAADIVNLYVTAGKTKRSAARRLVSLLNSKKIEKLEKGKYKFISSL